MSDNWDCYLQGVSTAGVGPCNSDIGELKRAQKVMDALKGVKDMTERANALCERADRIEKRRRDAFEGSAEPLAAVS
jgi:hypothetical protein